MFSINNRVWITSSRKIDGRYNKGVIVGIEKAYNKLGFLTEAQFFRDFEEYRYKVAYIDVFTGKANSEWVHYSELSKTKPSNDENAVDLAR